MHFEAIKSIFHRHVGSKGVCLFMLLSLVLGFLPLAKSQVVKIPERIDISLPSIYANGCHLSNNESIIKLCLSNIERDLDLIYLLGDSHAAQWVPALESKELNKSWKVKFVTKSSCPYVSINLNTHCEKFLSNVMADIRKERPRVLLLSSMTNGSYKNYLTPEYYSKEWMLNLESFLARIPKETYIVFIEDTPYANFNTTECLSQAKLRPCTFENRITTLTKSIRDFASSKKFGYINFTSTICQANYCNSADSKLNYFRDAHHISVSLSKRLGNQLKDSIEHSMDQAANS